MKIECPNPDCGERIDWGKSDCPACGKSVTVGSLFRRCWRDFVSWFRHRATVECPQCHDQVSLKATTCPKCGAAVTVGAVFDAAVEPARKRWHDFLRNAPPEAKRRVFRIYLLFSVALFWVAVGYVERQFADRWMLNAMLSVVYLTVIAMLVRWIVPPKVFALIPRRLYPSMKLSLFFNYLTLLLGVQIFIGTWWERASIIAGLFGVTFASSFLLRKAAPYFLENIGHFFAPPGPEPRPGFDHTHPQGRNVR